MDTINKTKGSVEHREEIADHDLKKLKDQANIVFDISNPCCLQNKSDPLLEFEHGFPGVTFFFHLCRWVRENLRQMTKSTFAVEVDASGRE
ncbi:hypothetical protein MAR_006434 [Mya arenaria]|uniref:Uncharacterized protein n=1 Tax=Mya arenaria TaxID=6604 RepID=A0ABY7D9J9_MYAAR|nr:hypothetical protein MAR_006434 [Mya arenaria]